MRLLHIRALICTKHTKEKLENHTGKNKNYVVKKERSHLTKTAVEYIQGAVIFVVLHVVHKILHL